MGHRDLLVTHPYISTDRQPLLRYLTRSVCRRAATFYAVIAEVDFASGTLPVRRLTGTWHVSPGRELLNEVFPVSLSRLLVQYCPPISNRAGVAQRNIENESLPEIGRYGNPLEPHAT